MTDLDTITLVMTSVGTEQQAVEISEEHRSAAQFEDSLSGQVAGTEKSAIEHAIERAGGNRTKAAKLLGISRASLYNKLKQYGIS